MIVNPEGQPLVSAQTETDATDAVVNFRFDDADVSALLVSIITVLPPHVQARVLAEAEVLADLYRLAWGVDPARPDGDWGPVEGDDDDWTTGEPVWTDDRSYFVPDAGEGIEQHV